MAMSPQTDANTSRAVSRVRGKRTAKSATSQVVVAPTAPKVVEGAPCLRPHDSHTRQVAIAEAAYYRAEQRGFASGCELSDWLAAEAEIDASTILA